MGFGLSVLWKAIKTADSIACELFDSFFSAYPFDDLQDLRMGSLVGCGEKVMSCVDIKSS